MLGTRDRTLLLDCLRPPPGYHLRRVVGTSFSLDLMTLLTVPLAFTFYDAHDEDGAPVADPIALLESLRRHSEKIAIFCQAGAIHVPKPDQRLLAWLEGSVFEAQSSNKEAIFHPKIWVLNFESEARSVYRILCLSRNLTFARSWDTCLCLEGEFAESNDEVPRNRPFSELLLAFPGLSTRAIPRETGEDLKRMAGEIGRVDFRTPSPFTDFRVHNFGLEGSRRLPFPRGGRSLVVSPFLGAPLVRSLVRDHGLEILVSRPESIEEAFGGLEREALPKTCYVLSPGANLDSRSSRDGIEQEQDGAFANEEGCDLAGLHAKLYVFENGANARLFTGSANATRMAFEKNTEVMVELIGRRKDCGIDVFLGSGSDARLSAIGSLLKVYRPSDSDHAIDESEQERIALEMSMDRLAREIGAVPLRATVRGADEEGFWDVALSGMLPEIPAGIQVKVWPVTLRKEAALRLDITENVQANASPSATGSSSAIASFTRLSFEALTAFFAFEVSSHEQQHDVRKRFTVTAELVGAPTDRKERLLRSFLSDRRQVLRLLLLVLTGDGADVSAFVQAARQDSLVSREAFGNWNTSALLEALLESLSRDPRRIDLAARLIEDLKKTPEGKDLLPEGLEEIWQPVWAAREALNT